MKVNLSSLKAVNYLLLFAFLILQLNTALALAATNNQNQSKNQKMCQPCPTKKLHQTLKSMTFQRKIIFLQNK